MNARKARAIESSLSARFEAQVQRASASIALRGDGLAWTYGEVNRCANRLARQSVGPRATDSTPVLLLIGHGVLEIIALLAVLKHGRAYVALDPQWPLPRLLQIVADVGARLVLTRCAHAGLAARLLIPVVELPEAAILLGAVRQAGDESNADANPDLDIKPEALASLVYTSGSTGTPKGVMRSHRSILHRCWLFQDTHQVGSGDHVAHMFSCGFVAAEVDVYGALLHGATLCSYPIRELGLSPLAAWLAAEAISLLHPPPALWRRFLAMLDRPLRLPALRTLFLAGETVFRHDIERTQQLFPGCSIEHRLSSSEASVMAQCVISPGETCPDAVVPAGMPVPDKVILLLDPAGQEVPPGATGEIVVLSRYLSPGYWRRPELTAATFIPVPEMDGAHAPPLMRFHTGDLGRFDAASGRLHHLGRLDAQVKIRGHRIESQEVEAALLGTGALKETAVFGAQDESGEVQLVGAVVPRHPKAWSAIRTRQWLAEQVPTAMIPKYFMVMPALPTTASGKIDRQRLVADFAAARVMPSEASPHPVLAADTTESIARIWAKVLRLDRSRIGLDDNFFHLGGDSLSGASLLVAVEKAFGSTFPAASRQRITTVREMARLLVQPVSVAPELSTPPALSPSDYNAMLAVAGRGKIPCMRPDSLIKVLNPDGAWPPLFWCFNDPELEMSGLCGRLAAAQPVYGLYSGSGQLSSADHVIGAIAAHYANEMLAHFPKGPFVIGGNCRGARVAFTLAQKIAASGREVSHLCLMESFHPGLFTYAGRVLLLYGKDSDRHAYRPFRWGAPGWETAFRHVPEVAWIPGAHGQFFFAPNVAALAEKLQTFLAAITETGCRRM